MSLFLETLIAAGAIAVVLVGALIALALFFIVLAWFSTHKTKGSSPVKIASVHGLVGGESCEKIVLASGEMLERCTFLGESDVSGESLYTASHLNDMIVFEDQSKKRYYIQTEHVRMIVVEPYEPFAE